MTTPITVAKQQGESANDATVRRLRSELKRLGISHSEAARRMELSQSAMSRLMNGSAKLTVDDIDAICAVTGVDGRFVIFEEGKPAEPAVPPHYPLRRARSRPPGLLLPRVDSNHQPFGSRPSDSRPRSYRCPRR